MNSPGYRNGRHAAVRAGARLMPALERRSERVRVEGRGRGVRADQRRSAEQELQRQHAQLRRTTRGVESRRAFNHSRDKETDGH
jgi:hypothetical protein